MRPVLEQDFAGIARYAIVLCQLAVNFGMFISWKFPWNNFGPPFWIWVDLGGLSFELVLGESLDQFWADLIGERGLWNQGVCYLVDLRFPGAGLDSLESISTGISLGASFWEPALMVYET